MALKAIDTYYKGYKFRSRLEAKWAVLFDNLNIKYLYEIVDGLEFDDGTLYLPDFYLPEINCFFEVKGVMNDKDEHKITKLVEAGYNVLIGYSDFSFCLWEPIEPIETNPPTLECYMTSKGDTLLVRCKKCGAIYPIGDCSWECKSCGYYDGDTTFNEVIARGDENFHLFKNAIWQNAFCAARSARFEHGETPNLCNKKEAM